MQYQLKSLTPPQIARLDEVPIAKQEQIIEKTGEPLKLLTAFYLVKNASADFTVKHEAAEKLDASMYTLLAGKGFFDGTMKTASKSEPVQTKPVVANQDKSKRLRIAQAKAKAQAARIRILKLKSQKAA